MESTEAAKGRIKTIAVDRSQTSWAAFDLESLIDEDHPARTIWKVSGQFDLSRFEEQRKSLEGDAGRPCWPAQLLVSVWVYSYTLGVASARAIARMMSHEPGLRWLTADQEINYHTLAEFRVGHPEALQELLAQLLTLLETAGLVDLDRLLHDGTKVRAVAGRSSLHRRLTLEKRLKQARKVVRNLDRQAEEANGEGMDEKRRAAQARAAREALQRAQAALEKVKENCGALPQQIIADNGYATRSNVEQTSEQKVELIAPWKEDRSREAGACARNGIEAEFAPSEFRMQRGGKKLTCPAGKTLVVIGQKTHHGVLRQVFAARPAEIGRAHV